MYSRAGGQLCSTAWPGRGSLMVAHELRSGRVGPLSSVCQISQTDCDFKRMLSRRAPFGERRINRHARKVTIVGMASNAEAAASSGYHRFPGGRTAHFNKGNVMRTHNLRAALTGLALLATTSIPAIAAPDIVLFLADDLSRPMPVRSPVPPARLRPRSTASPRRKGSPSRPAMPSPPVSVPVPPCCPAGGRPARPSVPSMVPARPCCPASTRSPSA